ncbi:MAG: hypothetical protein JWO67_6808 [Streptosporangiaceae bacterium]|jgi:hypothetical protein|nr:hypothetical protein [Streptosporangiaceae bacterium]
MGRLGGLPEIVSGRPVRPAYGVSAGPSVYRHSPFSKGSVS